MGAIAGLGPLVDFQRVARDDPQFARKVRIELGQCRKAARVAFDRNHPGTCIQYRTRQAARTGTNFIDGCIGQ